jgi:predicted ATP-binding protein involved in virulence
VPFHFLSDGYRNLLAIFADLAYRCVTLNPHFGREANYKSEGVVLIDELDLHLHPSWQKNIISQLKKTFPRIQFVATTHSPFLIQETAEGELFRLQSDGGMNIGGADNYSLEDIAEYIQNVSDPAWSMKKKEMYEVAKEYFYLIDQLVPGKSEQDLNIIREKLNIIGKAYSDNVAYTAFLEQKRFLAEAKL